MTAVLLALVPFGAGGCSSGGGGASTTPIRVTGVVSRHGTPLTVGPNGRLIVTFIGEADRGQACFVADADEGKGKFIITELRPGKYKVAVEQFDPYPKDLLKGAYSPEKTTLEQEISAAAEQQIQIKLPN